MFPALFGSAFGGSGSSLGLGKLFGGSAINTGINSALGAVSTAWSDIMGDSNRRDQAEMDWDSYKKKSELDWNYYHLGYAPLNQRLQQEMFDYTSAGNLDASKDYYDYTYNKGIQSVADKKDALLKSGYNPILAVNGGLGAIQGSTIGAAGQLGATGSPHSASGVSVSALNPNARLGNFDIRDMLSVLTTAKSLDKMDADIDNVKALTAKAIADTEKPGAVGQAERSLESIAKQIGEHANSAWSQALEFIKNYFNPVQEKQFEHRDYDRWHYDKESRGVIYAPPLNYD